MPPDILRKGRGLLFPISDWTGYLVGPPGTVPVDGNVVPPKNCLLLSNVAHFGASLTGLVRWKNHAGDGLHVFKK